MSELAERGAVRARRGHADNVAPRQGHYGWAAPRSLRGRLCRAKAQARRPVTGAARQPEVAGQIHNANNDFPGNSAADNLPVRPGSHNLEVVASSNSGRGLSLGQCDTAKAVGTRTVQVSSGSPTMLSPYGADPQRVKFLVTTVG